MPFQKDEILYGLDTICNIWKLRYEDETTTSTGIPIINATLLTDDDKPQGSMPFYADRVFRSQEEAFKAISEEYNANLNRYLQNLNSVEALLRFAFTYPVNQPDDPAHEAFQKACEQMGFSL